MGNLQVKHKYNLVFSLLRHMNIHHIHLCQFSSEALSKALSKALQCSTTSLQTKSHTTFTRQFLHGQFSTMYSSTCIAFLPSTRIHCLQPHFSILVSLITLLKSFTIIDYIITSNTTQNLYKAIYAWTILNNMSIYIHSFHTK